MSIKNGYKIYRDEQEDLLETKKTNHLIFFMFLIIIILVPLAAKLHGVNHVSPIITEEPILSSGEKGNIFSYYKFFILVAVTIFISLAFLYKVLVLKNNILKSKINIYIGTMVVFVALSTLFSNAKIISLFGMYDRHEGSITYLCYFFLFYIALNIQVEEKKKELIFWSLVPFVIINFALGLLNLWNINILNKPFIQKMVYGELPEGATIREGSFIITTLGHGNYLSGTSAMITVIFLILFILSNSLSKKIIYGILTILSFATLITSLSSSGFVTTLSMIPIVVIMVLYRADKKLKIIRDFSIMSISFLLIIFIFSKIQPRVWDETIGLIIKQNPFQVSVESFKGIPKELSIFSISEVDASNASDFTPPELPEAGVAAGTGRVYIWEKTIELIKNRPIFGYGLDTFAYYFNQDDPQKHANLNEGYSVIVDKPHNIYLNLAYGAGVITLIGFLTLIINYVKSIIRVVKTINMNTVALVCGCLAYLFQGMFNDSTIGAGVIFWILFGLSFNSLLILEANRKEADI
ncbi:O-antigen ligase family protein [Neobacillus piezotolerans]|uniref:O-antigen ligase family protein n=1 Tax=Neobacillus piezotolerans TaxID=2259171 RepID=A0A3D8GSY1_9BACI|nr:O-antigen ligase family protein [Neobacillus piezotolerans]RDU37548.1 O-antigen ligase family protein [Neobacillus piezotolerans]